jgi:pimeloyl-ACP methyl ester carboxylesterase
VLDAWTETWLLPLFDDWSLSPWLARVRCPVLAIHGDQDEFGSHAFPRRIAAEVAGPSQLLLLDHCGHVPHRELPQAVLDSVCGFLQQHDVR